ncbi:site-specific DNA-methyltransferase [Thermodesulfovibrio hydrogeniphilus]
MGDIKGKNLIIFGDCRFMEELPDSSVHLVVTSPPYFNAPFDYPDLFKNYEDFLSLIKSLAIQLRRVLAPGRIACSVTQDVRVKGKLYPITSDIMRIFCNEGFIYRDKIIWKKPEGYIRISRRSGVLIQHPYPMYFYPDNIYEEILIFQNGYYKYPKKIDLDSKIDINEFNKKKWYLSVWEIVNVLPNQNSLEKGIAAFPEEIPYRLIKLYSYKGETVLDPFAGSGTTLKMAIKLGRRAVGYEIDLDLLEVIKKKLGIGEERLFKEENFEIIIREDALNLRSHLQKKIKEQKSVARK